MGSETFDFSIAFKFLKEGKTLSRLAWPYGPKLEISTKVQFPDENSANTKPYLYMTKVLKNEEGGIESTDRFPLDMSCESMFAEDWYLVD